MITKSPAQFTARPGRGTTGAERRVASGPGSADQANPAVPETEPGQSSMPERGYSLIEFVGVLAVVAILAAMLIPVVVNDLQAAAYKAEIANLNNMNNAFLIGVTRTCQIPAGTNWSATLANWLTLPSANIATNGRGYARVYVYDTNGFGAVQLPYTQANGLAAVPGNPRLMIISSLSATPPVISGGISSNAFTAIWNTTTGYLPSTWTNWSGKGSDLVVQRINLAPIFHLIVLSAVDTNKFGSITVQSSTNVSPYITVVTNSLVNAWNLVGSVITNVAGTVFAYANGVDPVPAVNAWFIQGTTIGLYDTNVSPLTPNLESSFVVQSDLSYVFENQAWRGQLTGWGTNGPAGINLSNVVASDAVSFAQGFTTCGKTFENCPLNPNDFGGSSRGDSCEALYGSFHTFMMDYNNWSKESFGAGSDNACIRLLNDDQNSIYNLTQNMCQ